MAAAFELTRPERGNRFEVTVYQQGWRLGGKGASGRGLADRIEEHGLHIWLGFYENAFRIMRDCYAEAGRDPDVCPLSKWTDAFVPEPYVGVADWTKEQGWVPWTALIPPAPGLPGDPIDTNNPFTVSSYLVQMVRCAGALLRAVQRDPGEPLNPATETRVPKAFTDIGAILGYGKLATLGLLLEALHTLESILSTLAPFPPGPVLQLIEQVATGVSELIQKAGQTNATVRRTWEVVDLVLAITRGCIREAVLFHPSGFDCLDDYDCREWMRKHGASEGALNGAFVRGLYDLAFGYENGDVQRPRIAAGQAIRGALRFFFTYRGNFFWKMQGGMGDVVFAPLYEVLRKRGVHFEFFHRLRNVGIQEHPGDSPHVSELTFDVQAEVLEGEYQPLVDVKGLPCWPAEPDFAQLQHGRKLRDEGRQFESIWDQRRSGERVLKVTQDFDFVILGVGIGVVPHVCSEILARDGRWRDMVAHVKTVPTQALQLWTTTNMHDLGWQGEALTISGFVEPFDTWADMRHLISAESWGAKHGTPPIGAIAYFCNVLADEETPPVPPVGGFVDYVGLKKAEILASGVAFLNRDVVHLWPAALDKSGQFRWDVLATAKSDSNLRGPKRLATQWVSANVSPSERYTLCLPGSNKYRISPLDNTYDNLTIAGDWTDCGFNEGCVEAAVMSGRLAAHALSGYPRLEDIVGYDYP